jgi:hypothetical protein
MIDFKNQTVGVFQPKPIVKWVVVYTTPMGSVETIAKAIEVCEKNDMDPNLCIKPVACAIAEDGSYEVIL